MMQVNSVTTSSILNVDIPEKGQSSKVHTYVMENIEVVMGNAKRDVPRCRLMELSSMFEVMLSGSWVENENNLLNLQFLDDSLSDIFLDYLATRQINFDEAPHLIVHLFFLAKQYQLTELSEACLKYLKEHLEDYDIYELMKGSVKAYLVDIIVICRERLYQSDSISIPILFKIAKKYKNYTPAEYCIKYIIKNKRPDLVDAFFKKAFEFNDLNLKLYAFMLAEFFVNRSITFFVEEESKYERWTLQFSFKSHSEQTKMLCGLAKECRENNITLSFSKEGLRKLLLQKYSIISEPLLRTLNDQFGIESVFIFDLDDVNLQAVAEIIPKPLNLEIHNSNLQRIPKKWSKNIRCVSLFNCNIVKLRALKAKDIKFWQCRKLKSIYAPNALELEFTDHYFGAITVSKNCQIDSPVPLVNLTRIENQ